jgi:hypothetical protein
MPRYSPHDLKLPENRSGMRLERLSKTGVVSRFLADLDADLRFSHNTQPGLVAGRTMHRKPMWQVPVSTECAMRAAGR